MAGTFKEITIDMTQQKTDIGTIETMVKNLRDEMGKMFAEMERLNGMWHGQANAAFKAQFIADHDYLSSMCDILDNLIDSLNNANKEYITCEANVNSIVDSIHI